MELRKVKKNGGSYFIGIPKYLVEWFGFKAGDYVRIEHIDNRIIIKPEHGKRSYKPGDVETEREDEWEA